ncbi:hypothetical protein J4465_00330 [Candidatus Pacearchaeota archaeon]|nr:hypothetical protein [Candidatus Pacearchaeota archaeon]
MPNLKEIAENAERELLKNSISIAMISDAKVRGMLYDLAEEGPNSNSYKNSSYALK